MSVALSHETNAEPNLTPILDMVFQLITFFMLVINFNSASLELSLKLPVVGSARPVDVKGQVELVILNIDAQGNLIVYGEHKDVRAYVEREAQASRLLARRTNPDFTSTDELDTTVVIRADRATPFSQLNRVLSVCQEQGYRHFAFKALNKPR